MPDQELCTNCLEPLCDTTKQFDRTWREGSLNRCQVCFVYPKALHHHRGGSPANALCTRAPVVEVKGCFECPAVGLGMECRLDVQLRDISYYLFNGVHKRGGELRSDWCRLLANKAGLTLRAALPADESPVLGPYPAPGLDEAVEMHGKTMEDEG